MGTPPQNCVKINVHACNHPQHNAGLAAVARDHYGDWIKASSLKMNTDDHLLLAIWAIYYGLILACNEGYTHVCLESDSAQAIHVLTANMHCNTAVENLFLNCRRLMARDWRLHLQHVSTKANLVAIKMANQAAQQVHSISHHLSAPFEVGLMFNPYVHTAVYPTM